MSERIQIRRLLIVTLILLTLWGGLLYRLVMLHGDRIPEYQGRGEKARSVVRIEPHQRGRILDRNGNILAIDVEMQHVNVDPKVLRAEGHVDFIARQLGRVLQMQPAMIQQSVLNTQTNRRQLYVKQYVPETEVEKLREMQLDHRGVFFEPAMRRNYPHRQLMSHVIGYANLERIGSGGIELSMERLLRGVDGRRETEVDGKRNELMLRRKMNCPSRSGADVHLTLDQHVQDVCEDALDGVMERFGAKAAWTIVQEVRTGRILAMANRPGFDPNLYGTADQMDLMNRAISQIIEPGSTFKVASIAAALNEGVVQPDDQFFCENGKWPHAGGVLRDVHGYGHLTVADILKKSSNIGTAKLMEQLGDRRLVRYVKDFGFGSLTGIRLPGEDAGIVNTPGDGVWSAMSLSRVSIGQGIGVTGIQLISMLSCMGNGGQLMRPIIVDRVVAADGTEVYAYKPEVVRRPVRPETAQLMCQLMTRVTEAGGTGARIKVDGFTVCGKTGSAQKFVGGSYSESAHVASFMGMLPAERPEIAILVVVDEPRNIHTGGSVAAPVFAEIANQITGYLKLRPVPAEYVWNFGDRTPLWSDVKKEWGP